MVAIIQQKKLASLVISGIIINLIFDINSKKLISDELPLKQQSLTGSSSLSNLI